MKSIMGRPVAKHQGHADSTDFHNHHDQEYDKPMPFPPNSSEEIYSSAVGGIPMGDPAVGVHVHVQPQPFITTTPPPQPWKTGLFDCCSDPLNAVITFIFPCVTFGQIAEIVDSGTTSCGTSGMWYGVIACCIAMPCIMSCTYRSKLRSKFGIVESPAPDFLVHCCCEHCALCQEYRELQERGFDPSIGWVGNLAKQQQQQQQGMMAPMQQRMI